ncbi:MAG: hypothetical protein Q8O47_04325 [Candidatus Bathyarchaeota archaeon]|nr:hypothetical protein [Candidatus Bathyarchaeota archaeon]
MFEWLWQWLQQDEAINAVAIVVLAVYLFLHDGWPIILRKIEHARTV